METFGERLRRLRRREGMNQQMLGDACGKLGKASVSAWEKDSSYPTFKNLIEIQRIFGISFDELILGHSSKQTLPFKSADVPIISWNVVERSNGPIDLTNLAQVEGWAPCAEQHSAQAYALAVNGHSMTAPIGRSYPIGRVIICDPEQIHSATSNKRVIARVLDTGLVTFKELVIEDGMKLLRSLNPQSHYAPIVEKFEVLAVVIGSYAPE